MLKIIWLGESGFLLEDEKTSIIIDPYLSDSFSQKRSDKKRLLPVQSAFAERKYDLLLLTHCHIDHTDPETVKLLLNNNQSMLIAGPISSYNILENILCRAFFAQLTVGNIIATGDFKITALPAIHSDAAAIGFKIEHKGKLYYFSGDTALLCGLQDRVPHNADAAFLCFNAGVGKNMDINDALRLAKIINPKCVVPFHYGLLSPCADVKTFMQVMKEEQIHAVEPEYCVQMEL